MKGARLSRHAAGALWSQKGKAFLMMIGTAVGIMLLTAVVGLSNGVQQRVDEIMSRFGPRSIMIFSGGGRFRGGGGRAASGATLKLQDYEALRNRLLDQAVMTAGIFSRDVDIKAGAVTTQTNVVCADPSYSEAFDWYVNTGTPIDVDDERAMTRVCVLGSTTATNLFGGADPVGKMVFINRVAFRVKGVLASRGSSSTGFDQDDRIWIPLSTGMNRLFHQQFLRFIRFNVRPGNDPARVAGEAAGILRRQHHIEPPQEDDFHVITAGFIAGRIHAMARTTELIGSALAAVALLVGGVVLMNILLLSLSERVPEIGLKRALGASRRDIFTEFLAEAVVVSLAGMLLGVLLGLVPVWVIPHTGLGRSMPMAVTWKTFVYAAVFSGAVGLFFGVQPARRAARLDPVEALR